ncbi:MAG TPA: hypothetical protein VJ869_06665 [Sphaerochaeta sp.]|nr:hypothetical protein [Sphaerochaeta sp.]
MDKSLPYSKIKLNRILAPFLEGGEDFSEGQKEITITRYQVESDKRVSEEVMAIFPCEL